MPTSGQALSWAGRSGGFDHRSPSVLLRGRPYGGSLGFKCETFVSWNQIRIPEDVKAFFFPGE